MLRVYHRVRGFASIEQRTKPNHHTGKPTKLYSLTKKLSTKIVRSPAAKTDAMLHPENLKACVLYEQCHVMKLNWGCEGNRHGFITLFWGTAQKDSV